MLPEIRLRENPLNFQLLNLLLELICASPYPWQYKNPSTGSN